MSPVPAAKCVHAKESAIGGAAAAMQTRRGSRVGVARRRRPESFSRGSASAHVALTAAGTGDKQNEDVMLSSGGARVMPRLRLSAARCETATRSERANNADLLMACKGDHRSVATVVAVVVEVVRFAHAWVRE
eukprot:1590859-Pleurochrysis_carterae.AAC.2